MNWNKQDSAEFPIQYDSDTGSPVYEGGVSLRDWFAGQAMSGIMANNDWHILGNTNVAKICYTMADAMLEVRK